jgi:HK97 family phage major capsid protein
MPLITDLPEKPTVPQIRSKMLEAGDYVVGLQRVVPDKRDDNWKTDMRSAVEFIHSFDAALQAYERSTELPASTGPAAGTAGGAQRHTSMGESIVTHEQYAQFARSGNSNATFLEHEVRGTIFSGGQQRSLIDTGTGTATAGDAGFFLPAAQFAITPNPRQARLFLRDLLAVVQTDLPVVPYIREYTPTVTELGASSVAEAAPKPEVDMIWETDNAQVKKIAAWVPVTTEIIEDAPTLRGYIDTRLGYMLAFREENLLLTGDGTGPRIKGILSFTTQTQTAVSGDPAGTLGVAIGKVENVDLEADGIAMNPIDYWAMLTTRSANQFDGGFSGGLPFGPGAMPGAVWGLPVVRSRSLASKTAIVGAFRMGATIFDRMRTTIRVGNQHSDYFTNNKVVVLAEERVALAVHRPDAFVKVTMP